MGKCCDYLDRHNSSGCNISRGQVPPDGFLYDEDFCVDKVGNED